MPPVRASPIWLLYPVTGERHAEAARDPGKTKFASGFRGAGGEVERISLQHADPSRGRRIVAIPDRLPVTHRLVWFGEDSDENEVREVGRGALLNNNGQRKRWFGFSTGFAHGLTEPGGDAAVNVPCAAV